MEHNEFEIKLASEICESIFDGTHDSPKYLESGYPLVTSKHLKSIILIEEAPKISKSDFEKINERSKIEIDDILISMIGTVGIVSIIRDTPVFAIKNIGVLRAKNHLDSIFIYYYMQSKYAQNEIKSLLVGSTQPFLSLTKLREFPILYTFNSKYKQHIVDTIGSVDDLIENYQNQINKIHLICNRKIDFLNKYCSLIDLSLITKFDKGIEIGSKNYFDKKEDGFISYIRVGDLLNQSNTYINQNIKSKTATYEDILIAFDGAPGRISYALRGAYSSGIYKIVPNDEFYKGLIYFELSSTLNQKIIKDNSQGTTILHASKSIPYLKYAQCSDEDIIVFNNFYKILINLKIKIDKLNNIKNILLNKYFTNQQ